MRYSCLGQAEIASSSDNKTAVWALMDKIGFDRERYRLGHTLVFFRAGALAGLEETRDDLVKTILPLNCYILMFVGDQMGAVPARRGSQEDPWGSLQEEVRPEGADQGDTEYMICLIFLILFNIV